ncbi:MAG: nucleotidyltransferase domain-containing protein [bacterium]
MALDELLKRIKERLENLYGERLKGVILYGSHARGDAGPDSDIDILCVLEGPILVYKEISATVDAVSDLELEMKDDYKPVSIIPVDREGFESAACGFYREVRKEGIPL